MTITNKERGYFRKVIRAHADYELWVDMGNKKTSEMSGADCEQYCDMHGIDVQSVKRAFELDWPPERALVNSQNGRNAFEPDLDDAEPAPKPEPVKPAPKAGAAAALDVLAQALQNSLTADEVKELVRSEVAGLGLQPEIHVVREDGQKVGELGALRHKSTPDLLDAVAANCPAWIAGPAGSGKSFAAKQVAQALDLDFAYHGAMIMAHELLGYKDGNGQYHETDFVRLYENGGVILLDEVDAGGNEALLALNNGIAGDVLATPKGMVERHPDFRIIAAANTWGLGATSDYVGRCRIDSAFLDRFVSIEWDYDEALERKLTNNTGWCLRVQSARRKARDVGLKVVISPRATIHGARLIAAGMSEDKAAMMTYLQKLTPAQRDMVEAA